MQRIEQKEMQLVRTGRKISALSREVNSLHGEIERLRRKKKENERHADLLRAGLLFEEAGILKSYDREKVLAALRSLKEDGNGRECAPVC